ncbi:MAG: glycosyltransferase family 1 protein, partial [Candidatus Methanofastidiosa archaeon]|nr:glycosyltransferase family 1 protein [Candidatus Methanofastidiosa archaeon]
MRTFLIITGLIHKKDIAGRIGGYGPYVREMNLWIKYFDKVLIVAPMVEREFCNIDLPYSHDIINIIKIPAFNLTTAGNIIKTILLTPYICLIISDSIIKSDHIHIRCPNNTGLLGCVIQIFFPKKKKTAKYASNWDWSIKQPWSYRLQQ